MNHSEFNPQELDVINRLANAPQPTLNPAAFEMIHAQMLNAMDTPPKSFRPGRRLGSRPPVIAAVVVTIALVSSMVILISISTGKNPTPTVSLTVMPTFTTVPPSVAPTGVIVTEAATLTSTTETTPEATATLESVIVVEGPVQSINVNVITIFGIDIALNADDPILSVLQVGDVLHIEADFATDTTTIVAVTVEPVSNEVNVNPSTGEIWRDDGNCDHLPPPWAPANGWRQRCAAAPDNGSPPENGNGMGMGEGEGNN